MKLVDVAHRLVLAAFVALGTHGAVAYALLLLGHPVPEWLALLAVLVGGAVAAKARVSEPAGRSAPPWLAWSAAGLLLAVTVALVFGVLATPPRHWDGAVAWELKAFWLSVEPTIEQPFFRDAGVFSHSRDYPLLQPVLIASGNRLLGGSSGRLLYPLLYLLLVATVGLGLRRDGRGGVVAWLCALAVGLTPMLITPTSGSADSGYAELFLATCVAGIAAGLLLQDRVLLFLGVFLAVLVKPEGLIYGAVAIPLLWCRCERGLLAVATAGWLLGAALWLPLQHDLYHLGSSSAYLVLWSALFVLGVLVLGSDVLLQHAGIGVRARAWVTVAAFPVVLLALPLLVVGTSDRGSTMGVYLQGFDHLLDRIPQLGQVFAGFLRYAFLHMGFTLTFWLPLLAVAVFWLMRVKPAAPRLWIFALLGLFSVFAPFLLSPESDIQHHLRSSMARLQLHWVGAVWILTGVWTAQLRARCPQEALPAMAAPDRNS